MLALLCIIVASLALPFKANGRLEAENAALRHQVMVLRRQVRGRVHLTNLDRLFLVHLYRWFLRSCRFSRLFSRKLSFGGIGQAFAEITLAGRAAAD